MREKPKHTLKLIVPAQKANPSPPIGPALGQKGVNLKEFCATFNSLTNVITPGTPLLVKVTINNDKSFEITLRGIPTSQLVKQLTINNLGEKCITMGNAKKAAEAKLNTLNTRDISKAIRIITGSIKSMGIRILNEVE